jgi:hypothetical protein
MSAARTLLRDAAPECSPHHALHLRQSQSQQAACNVSQVPLHTNATLKEVEILRFIDICDIYFWVLAIWDTIELVFIKSV